MKRHRVIKKAPTDCLKPNKLSAVDIILQPPKFLSHLSTKCEQAHQDADLLNFVARVLFFKWCKSFFACWRISWMCSSGVALSADDMPVAELSDVRDGVRRVALLRNTASSDSASIRRTLHKNPSSQLQVLKVKNPTEFNHIHTHAKKSNKTYQDMVECTEVQSVHQDILYRVHSNTDYI